MSADPTPAMVALRPGGVFDGTGSSLRRDVVVLVDRGRITGIEPIGIELPPSATVVDLPDTTLLPGLVDTHVHLAFDASFDAMGALATRDEEATLAVMAASARTALHAGVTTVRDLGDLDYGAVALRASGHADGPLPTIVAAGPPITTPGGHCHSLGGGIEPGVADVRAAVREHLDRGADVIKVMASGGFLTPGSSGEVPQFGPEELRAIVDEAHRHGVPVTAHAHGTRSIVAALDAGVDGVEHCSFVGDDGEIDAPQHLIDGLARRRVAIGATLGVIPEFAGGPPPGVEPPPILRLLPAIYANYDRLRQAGATILAGTDAGIFPGKPHDVLPYGVAELAQLGFAPHEALRSATADAAQVCGLGDRKGRIAPGFDADLLLVAGDPLADLAALRDVVAVYQAGQPVVAPAPTPAPV